MSAAPNDDLVARLPHQPPMRLVEHVIELIPGERARASRVARADDWYFNGHFPGNPVVPAIILVELLAQTGGLAAADGLTPAAAAGLRVAGLAVFKFPTTASVGATLEAEAHVTLRLGNLIRIAGSVTADGTVVATGELTLASLER